jgi:hypothetical protein
VKSEIWRLWGVLGILGAGSMVTAGELSGEDFSVRFPAALSRFANYGDVAGLGGASVASPWTSSANPAALSWTPVSGEWGTYNALQFHRIEFKSGSRFDIGAGAIVWQSPQAGTFSLGVAKAESNEAVLSTGFGFVFDTILVDLSWGLRLSELTAIGVGFRWTDASVDNRFAGTLVARAESPGYVLRAGVLHQLRPRLLVAAMAEVGRSEDTTDLLDMTLPVPTFIHFEDPLDQWALRAGFHWNYERESALYSELTYASFENGLDSLAVFRASTGVEQQLVDGVFLRAGCLYDLKWETASWTLGLGLYPSDRLSIDFAWQHNFYPEIENEFGKAETYAVSVSISI